MFNSLNQLYSYPEMYDLPLLPENRQDYLESLLINGTWGDGITLQAAADFYGVRILVLKSHPVRSFFEVLPNVPLDSLRFDRVIHLSYLQDEHYNSLYPAPREIRRLWGNSPNSHYWL